MAEDKTARFINQINQDLEDLSREQTTVATLIPSLAVEIDDLHKRSSEVYAQNLRHVALGDKRDAELALEDLQKRLAASRVRILKEVTDTSLKRVERIIRNPFWVGERSFYVEVIERVRQTLLDLESTDQKEALRLLGTSIEDISKLERRMENDENRTRVRAPFQIFIWGFPIVIGLWLSDKFSFAQNAMAVGILFGVSIFSYFALRFRILSRFKIRKPKRLSAFTAIQIPMILVAISVTALPSIEEYVIKSRMDIKLGPIERPVTPNSEVNVPFSLQYDHERPAVGVSVRLEAPGIIQSLEQIKYNALAKDQDQTGSFLISIPNDIPQGVYLMELSVSYTAGPWIDFFDVNRQRFIKETISVNIIVE